MAVRVQTQDDVAFGIMENSVTVTHVRFQKAGANPVVKLLTNSVTAAAGERLRIPSGSLDMVYPANEFTNAHMEAVVTPYWDSETIQIDMLTDATTIVADTGYSQQTYSNWAISTESD